MTSPNNTRDDLSALLDGELDDAELAALEQELEGDDGLRAELEELRGLSDGLRSLADVTAPSGFLAGVMGRIDAGEGIGEGLDDLPGAAPAANDANDRDDNVVPLVAAAEEITDEPLPDNVVRFPWWMKGPALTAVAALLLVGVGLAIRDQGPAAPPMASEVAMRAPLSEAAPIPTGTLAADADLFDAVADADADEEDPAPREAAERIQMKPAADDRVAGGGAGTGPAVPSAPRRSGIREADGASPPPGVLAVAEAEYAPEPEPEDAVAMADEEADIDHEVEMADEGLIPPRPAPASLGVAKRSAPSAADAPRDAMTAVASLRTADREAVNALRAAAQRRGWTLAFVSPSEAAVTLSDVQPEQVVELLLKPGDEIAAQRVLDGLGEFQFASTPEVGDGERSRLRITVIFAP